MSLNPKETILCIDFGTSHSKMAWYNAKTNQAEIIKNAEGEEHTPSLVYYGKQATLVGKAAENMLEDEDQREYVITSIKRKMTQQVETLTLPNGRIIRCTEVISEILGKLKRDAEQGHFHQQTITQVVITYPTSFIANFRLQLHDAAMLAGFAPNAIELIEEPVAAALAFARQGFKVGNTILVYDFGGGTFDLALLKRETNDLFKPVMPSPGIEQCGGDDLDLALYKHYDQLAHNTLGRGISLTSEPDAHFLHECRQQKEVLTLNDHHKFNAVLSGPALFHAEIERTAFENLARPIIQRTIQKTQDLLNRAAAMKEPRVETILLIGGSSSVPLVEELLKKNFSQAEVRKWQRSREAVALGAAYYYAKPSEEHRVLAKDDKQQLIRLKPLGGILIATLGLAILSVLLLFFIPMIHREMIRNDISAAQTIQANNIKATAAAISVAATVQAYNINATATAVSANATVQAYNINATATAISVKSNSVSTSDGITLPFTGQQCILGSVFIAIVVIIVFASNNKRQ